MGIILNQSLPIIGLILLGFVLKQVGMIRRDDGHALVRVIVNATMPPLVFMALWRARVDPRQLGLLAVCGAAIPLLLYGVATRVVKAAGWKPEVAGVVVLGAMIANVALFLSAFTLTFHGQEGLSLVAAFDVGNSLVASSVAH